MLRIHPLVATGLGERLATLFRNWAVKGDQRFPAIVLESDLDLILPAPVGLAGLVGTAFESVAAAPRWQRLAHGTQNGTALQRGAGRKPHAQRAVIVALEAENTLVQRDVRISVRRRINDVQVLRTVANKTQ